MTFPQSPQEQVTTALLLAAGTGSRLYPLTKKEPKCLTIVNGTSILERLVSNLSQHGFKRLIIVTGHLEHCIRNFLGKKIGGMEIEYVFSPLYKTTNNIYSLWMARKLLTEPFLLVESDLVFDESLLKNMLTPDRIATAKMQPWMNGTCITEDSSQNVKAFLGKNTNETAEQKYKTVNIYSFSTKTWSKIKTKLNQYISSGKVNDYYETVFAKMIEEGSISLKNISFDSKPWYEIDTIDDLSKAEKLFKIKKHSFMAGEKQVKLTLTLPVINSDTNLINKTEVLNAVK